MSGYNNFNEVNSNFEEQKCSKQDVNKKKTRIFTERCMEGRGYVILDKDM